MSYTTILAMLFLGSIAQATTGIGFGMIAMAFLPYLFPYLDAMVAIRIAGFCFLLPFFLKGQIKHVKWKILAVPTVTSTIGSLLATLLLFDARYEKTLEILLGSIIIVMGLYSLIVKTNLHFKANLLSGTVTGIVMGFFSGACGVAGPPAAMYYLNVDKIREDKDAYYATTIMTFQLVGIVQLFILFLNGKISQSSLLLSAKACVPVIAGIITGRILYNKLNIEIIKKIIYLFMTIMGISVIITHI